MTIQLSTELEQLVKKLVNSGDFADEQQVFEAALRLLDRRSELRAEIRVGLDQLDRGECYSAEEVFADVRARIAEIGEAQP